VNYFRAKMKMFTFRGFVSGSFLNALLEILSNASEKLRTFGVLLVFICLENGLIKNCTSKKSNICPRVFFFIIMFYFLVFFQTDIWDVIFTSNTVLNIFHLIIILNFFFRKYIFLTIKNCTLSN